MSNKNKIAIVFEALGLDKVISSLSDFTKKLTSTEKSTKQTTKATEELDEETKKLGSSLQKASSEINKTETSTKNLNNTNKESKKTTEDLDTSIKNQTNNYKDLVKQLEEQKKARNSLVEEALSKENKSVDELLKINGEYIGFALSVLFFWTGIPAILSIVDFFRFIFMDDETFKKKYPHMV